MTAKWTKVKLSAGDVRIRDRTKGEKERLKQKEGEKSKVQD